MKRILPFMTALLLTLPAAAQAQDHHGHGGGGGGHGGGGHGGGGHGGGGGEHRGAPGGGGSHFGGRPGGGHFGGGMAGGRGERRGGMMGAPTHGAPIRGSREAMPHEAIRSAGRGGNFQHAAGGFHGGRGGGHAGFHSHANFHPVRGGAFHYPRGYGYRRWSVGGLLPRIFLGSSYYWNDYGALGLYPPPYGDRWVRNGPDLLLVHIRTGRIDDVIYGAFY